MTIRSLFTLISALRIVLIAVGFCLLTFLLVQTWMDAPLPFHTLSSRMRSVLYLVMFGSLFDATNQTLRLLHYFIVDLDEEGGEQDDEDASDERKAEIAFSRDVSLAYSAILGRKIRSLRIEQHISVEEMAASAGFVPLTTWVCIENGTVPLTVDQLNQAANRLGLSMVDLVQHADTLYRGTRSGPRAWSLDPSSLPRQTTDDAP